MKLAGVRPYIEPVAFGLFLEPVKRGSKDILLDPFSTDPARSTSFEYNKSVSISLSPNKLIVFWKKSFNTLNVLPPTTPTPAIKYPDWI